MRGDSLLRGFRVHPHMRGDSNYSHGNDGLGFTPTCVGTAACRPADAPAAARTIRFTPTCVGTALFPQ